MQKGIYFFPLPCILDRIYDAEYPRGMQVLGVELHKGYPKLLGLLDPAKAGKDLEKRHFRIFKTGDVFSDDGLTYIDSFSLPNLGYLHVFEYVYGTDGR